MQQSLVEIQDRLERTSQDELISTKRINYRYLHNLLSIGNWREADKETYRILIKVFPREEWEWLTEEDIEQISNEDLLIINRLWMQHSNGRFSYSTQKRLLEDLSARLDRDKHDLFFKEKFGSLVGWHRDSEWLNYQQLIFKLSAPEGHLPTVPIGWYKEEEDWLRYVHFLSLKVF